MADHRLKVTHDHRVRVRADDRADDVVRSLQVRRPIADRLVGRVFQRARAGRHTDDSCAQQFHPKHVERLPRHVDLAHIDVALQAEHRRRRRRGHAVLARAGLGDQPRFAHPPREQRLAEGVVDLVRAGVVQVLALEVDRRAAHARGQARGFGQRRRPTAIVPLQRRQFGLKLRVAGALLVESLQFEQGGHQRLGGHAPAELAEAPAFIRLHPRLLWPWPQTRQPWPHL
jgi:hypothetical protein